MSITRAVRCSSPTLVRLAASACLVASLPGSEWFIGTGGSNGNPGTQAAPFATFAKATSVLQPGDTITYLDGTYIEDDRVLKQKSGTASAWITIRAKNRGKALLRVSSDATESNVLTISASNYILIEGLEGRGSMKWNAQSASGITIQRSHHVAVRNCVIHDCAGSGIGSGPDGWDYLNGGMKTGPNDFLVFEGNTVYGCAFYNQYLCSGISVYQARSAGLGADPSGYNIIIRNNTTFGNANLINHYNDPNQPPTDGNGIILDDGRNSQTTIAAPACGPFPYRSLIENNVCFSNGGRGVHVFLSDHVNVRHNTCWHNGMALDGTPADLSSSFSVDALWTNNLGISAPNGTTAVFGGRTFTAYGKQAFTDAYSVGGGTQKTVFRKNMLIGPYILDNSCNDDNPGRGWLWTTSSSIINNANLTTIADAKLVNPQANGLGSSSFRPAAGSPLINAGSTIAGDSGAVDRDGNARWQSSAPDIGAYETSSGSSAPGVVYDFEGSTQGWGNLWGSPQIGLLVTSGDTYVTGGSSLKSWMNNTTGSTQWVAVMVGNPTGLTAGKTVTMRYYLSGTAGLAGVQPFAQGSANSWMSSYIGSPASGSWQTAILTIPANAGTITMLGFQIGLNNGASTTLYLDSITY